MLYAVISFSFNSGIGGKVAPINLYLVCNSVVFGVVGGGPLFSLKDAQNSDKEKSGGKIFLIIQKLSKKVKLIKISNHF